MDLPILPPTCQRDQGNPKTMGSCFQISGIELDSPCIWIGAAQQAWPLLGARYPHLDSQHGEATGQASFTWLDQPLMPGDLPRWIINGYANLDLIS